MESMPSTPPAQPVPGKKSNAPMIIALIAAVILSICCCLPGIINVISPMPYNSTFTDFTGQTTSDSGTIPAWYGIFCVCAALIPLLAVGVFALVQRSKK